MRGQDFRFCGPKITTHPLTRALELRQLVNFHESHTGAAISPDHLRRVAPGGGSTVKSESRTEPKTPRFMPHAGMSSAVEQCTVRRSLFLDAIWLDGVNHLRCDAISS